MLPSQRPSDKGGQFVPTTVTYNVAMEIAAHESIILMAYKDSGGTWTWSVGLTHCTGHDVERYKDNPSNLAHALLIYAWALDNYADAVRKAFSGYTLTEAQFAAALSFHWNTGAIADASWVGHVRAGRMASAERAFRSWNKSVGTGTVLRGLVTRRTQEWRLFTRGMWTHDGTMLEYTRVASNYTPDWSSGRKINVENELKAALATHNNLEPDTEPTPDAPVSDS